MCAPVWPLVRFEKVKLTSAELSSGARVKVAVPLPAGETGGISLAPVIVVTNVVPPPAMNPIVTGLEVVTAALLSVALAVNV
jgi:hypothetical protein